MYYGRVRTDATYGVETITFVEGAAHHAPSSYNLVACLALVDLRGHRPVSRGSNGTIVASMASGGRSELLPRARSAAVGPEGRSSESETSHTHLRRRREGA